MFPGIDLDDLTDDDLKGLQDMLATAAPALRRFRKARKHALANDQADPLTVIGSMISSLAVYIQTLPTGKE